jgi:hypothetical protein
MDITIQISYKTNNSHAIQKGSFPLRKRKPEEVALDWWKQIKKEMSYQAVLEKVIVEFGRDITENVKVLEEQEWSSIMNDKLPF